MTEIERVINGVKIDLEVIVTSYKYKRYDLTIGMLNHAVSKLLEIEKKIYLKGDLEEEGAWRK